MIHYHYAIPRLGLHLLDTLPDAALLRVRPGSSSSGACQMFLKASLGVLTSRSSTTSLAKERLDRVSEGMESTSSPSDGDPRWASAGDDDPGMTGWAPNTADAMMEPDASGDGVRGEEMFPRASERDPKILGLEVAGAVFGRYLDRPFSLDGGKVDVMIREVLSMMGVAGADVGRTSVVVSPMFMGYLKAGTPSAAG